MVENYNPRLGPPLTDDEKWDLVQERGPRKRIEYRPETYVEVVRLIEFGATYQEIFDRTEFEEIVELRNYCYRRGLSPRLVYSSGRAKSQEVHQMVRDLVAQDLTYRQIFDRMPGAFPHIDCLRIFMRKYGYVQKRLAYRIQPQAVIGRIWELVRQGYSAHQIATMLPGDNLNRNKVCGIIWGYGLRNIKEKPERFRRIYGSCKSDPPPRHERRSPTSTALSW